MSFAAIAVRIVLLCASIAIGVQFNVQLAWLFGFVGYLALQATPMNIFYEQVIKNRGADGWKAYFGPAWLLIVAGLLPFIASTINLSLASGLTASFIFSFCGMLAGLALVLCIPNLFRRSRSS